ncbi:unnamed protein product [Effrenium voratum]|nr:unnamed protein product [Effrenium voratum]
MASETRRRHPSLRIPGQRNQRSSTAVGKWHGALQWRLQRQDLSDLPEVSDHVLLRPARQRAPRSARYRVHAGEESLDQQLGQRHHCSVVLGRRYLSAAAESPLTWYETENYHMHLAASPDATYIYVSGTLGEIQARFIESVSAAVRRMLQSPLCQMKDVCNTDSVTYHGKDPIELPHYLESLPLQWLGLQDAKIRVMSPEPPISMRAVNLSGAGLSDWQSMSTGWFSIPSIIDISATPAYVSVPILHGQAVRLVTDQNCVDAASQKEKGLNFCILRSAQKEDQLCATHFESHDMTREALAAKVTGSPLPVKTVILVDQEDFIAWLCDCPAGRFGTNGSHCEICPLNHYCPAAGNDTRARNFRASPCPPGAGTTGIGLTSIKQCECLPGFYTVKSTTDPGGFLCRSCPPGASSFSYGMMECQACQFGYRSYDWPRLQPSNFCFPDWFGLGFMIALQLAMIQLVYSTWRHFQGLAINEVKVQHGKWVVSTMGRRELWIFPCLETFQVSFRKTGNPWLDDPQKPYRVRAIRGSDLRLVLLQGGEEMKAESSWPGLFGEDDDYDSSEVSEEGQAVWTSRIRLDTSQGFIRLSCPFACLCGRILPAVVICPLLFLASGILLKLAVYRKIWIMLGLPFTTVIALLVVAGAYFSAPAPAMHNNVLNFRHLLPPPKLVPRGGARAVKVESIEHLLNHFRFSIGDRDMYYVNSNILLPVTKPTQLSFAELAGPVQTKYFVSHYWGIPFENSMQSIMKHSWTTEREKWQSAAYWCCSFSNNQWSIAEELGNGDIAQSSFYLALTDPRTCATVMVLDEKAQALKRVWCLFEVLQTCILSQKKPGFEGLFLCTPSGVLNKESAQSDGSLSIDTAIAVARSLRHLKLEEASATNPADKVMIDELVERYPGKHEAMNRFVRRHIRDALNLIREHHNQTFAWLLRELERSERSESGPLAPGMSRAPPIFPTMPVTSVSLSSLPSGSSRGHMSQKSLSSVCPSGHLLEPNGEDSSGSSSESEHFVAPRPK